MDRIACKASDVGIAGISVYFPRMYVAQTDLEVQDSVSPGKYTKGIGQVSLAVPAPNEDIASMCLTVLARLMQDYQIHPNSIGRLEVGTETLIDKAKSVKTTLMQLLGKNVNCEGVTVINACYGAAAALFNTVAWMQSEAWDGRLGVVISADIAIYDIPAAKATGGAGAVALLIAPDAGLVMEPHRVSYFTDAYDFFKPNPASEFPVVQGKYSMQCYLNALAYCWPRFKLGSVENTAQHYIFHQPFYTMAVKAFQSLFPKDTPKVALSKMIAERLAPGAWLCQLLGNTYSASIFLNVASVLHKCNLSRDERIAIFTYGSGLASTMFSMRVSNMEQVTEMKAKLGLDALFSARVKVQPARYDSYIAGYNEKNSLVNWTPPVGDSEGALYPGTWVLKRIANWQREYEVFLGRPSL